MKKILGLGNALTDVLYKVSEEDLAELGLPKGSMNLISMDQALKIQLRFSSVRMHMVAGGSACNTISAIASLGGKTAFIGKIGTVGVGDFYRDVLYRDLLRPGNAILPHIIQLQQLLRGKKGLQRQAGVQEIVLLDAAIGLRDQIGGQLLHPSQGRRKQPCRPYLWWKDIYR